MHWIQKDILKRLSGAESCRYSELKPENVDGNLFMYHLNQLMADKYVRKVEKDYSLTSKGKTLLGGLRLSLGKTATFPRLFTMIYGKNSKGELLLYKWNRQPYLGHISLPFSRILRGQTIIETATDTLKYKSGLVGKLEYRGICEVIVRKDEEITTHYIAHIFELPKPGLEISADGLTGQPLWGDPNDYQGSELVYGTKEIIEVLNTKKSPFFEEILVRK